MADLNTALVLGNLNPTLTTANLNPSSSIANVNPSKARVPLLFLIKCSIFDSLARQGAYSLTSYSLMLDPRLQELKFHGLD